MIAARAGAALLLAAVAAAAPAGAQQRMRVGGGCHFAVLGHIRRPWNEHLNPRLGELLDEVRARRPDFVVLSGDIIWGDARHAPTRTDSLEAQWNAVDSALATLGVPVYRAPGNHDMLDENARAVWVRRYGAMPQRATTPGGCTLLLLNSVETLPADWVLDRPYPPRRDLDTAQLAFVRAALADSSRGPTFAVVHHVLWWQPADGRWWREVHPLLAAGRVDAVFSGDLGPMKFSWEARDGVRYFQSSIETPVPDEMLRGRLRSRLLSSQFDNWLEVTAAPGAPARIEVHTVAEVSSGMFTAERWRAVESGGPRPSLRERVEPLVNTPKKIAAWSAAALLLMAAGFALGRVSARR